MRLAIFGGTFDPIHQAHLAVAREAADRFHLDRVLFIPAARPPHKQHGACAPYEDRVRMAEMATAGDPLFRVCAGLRGGSATRGGIRGERVAVFSSGQIQGLWSVPGFTLHGSRDPGVPSCLPGQNYAAD